MTGGHPVFTAASSAAGYYYQARLALFESLRLAYGESSVDVAIERFDDVSFEKDGNPLELLQTKHHINKVGDLTDSSPDLWKTLRVWSEATKETPSLPSRTRLVLVTTGQAPETTAASFLRPDDKRDVDKAEALLAAVAGKSENKGLHAAFLSFQSLAPEMRRSLLSAVEILDQAPVLTELGALIEDRLKLIAPRDKAPLARELLEGWWWPRICHALPFCGELLFRAVSDYRKFKQQPFSFALSFLVLPIVLHKPTRDQLPGKASTAFVGWVADHGPSLAQLPDRVLRLVPVTREALLFLVQHNALRIEEGGLVPGVKPIRLSEKLSQTTNDVAESRGAAALLGRWFANQGSASSILQGLGVSP